MADPRTNPLLDPKNDDLISSYINKLPTSEENKDALFNVLIEADPVKYKSGMKDLWGKGGELRDLTAKLHQARNGISKGAKLEDAFNQYVFTEGKSTVPAPSKEPSYMQAFNRGIAEGISRMDQAVANVLGYIPGMEKVSARVTERAKQVQKESEEQYGAEPTSIGAQVARGIGATAPDILRHAPMARLTGPLAPIGMALTEYATNIHKGTGEASKAAVSGLAMALGGKFTKQYVGNLLDKLPASVKAKLPTTFVDALSEGAGFAGTATGLRTLAGEETTAAKLVEETILGAATPTVAGVAKKTTARKQAPAAKPAATKPATTPGAPRKYELTPDPSGKVTDPFTGKIIDLKSGEMAFHVEDTTYVVSPTGVPNSYKVSQGLEGTNRKYVGRYGSEPDPESLALKLHRTFSPAKQTAPPPTSAAKATPTQAAPAPAPAPAPAQAPAAAPTATAPTATPVSKKTSAKKAAAPAPAVATPPAAPAAASEAPTPATAPLESVYTDTPKGKPQRTVAIKFENEQQKSLYDTIQNARTGDANAVAVKAEAVNKYAQDNNISVEQAQKALDSWATKTFMRAKNQPTEAPEGKRLEIEATPIAPPKSEAAKPAAATPPPPPVAAAPVATPETVTTETVVAPSQETPAQPSQAALAASSAALSAPKTLQQLWESVKAGEATEGSINYGLLSTAREIRNRGGLKDYDEFYKFTNEYGNAGKNARTSAERESKRQKLVDKYSPKGTPAPATPAPPPPVKPQAPGKKEKAEASVAGTPAPPPVTAAKVTEAETTPGVETETVTTETPTITIEAPTPGKYKHSFRKGEDTELSFDNQGDLAIGLSRGNKALARHINKLATIYVDGKPITGNKDLAINLMREYQGHLRDLSAGKAPSIEEFAKNTWKDKARVTSITGATKAIPISEGMSQTKGTPTQMETLERIKFLRDSISNNKAVIALEVNSERDLNELKARAATGEFRGARANEYQVKLKDLTDLAPGGELNRQAKADIVRNQKELETLLGTAEGKRAMEIEAAQKAEAAEQSKAIEAASKRPTRPVPVMEADLTPKPAPESKAAEILAKVEPKPVEYVPTMEDARKISRKIEEAEDWIRDDQSVLNIRDTTETLKNAAIQKKKAEVDGVKELIEELSKKKQQVSAEEALRKSGKDSPAILSAKLKLEKLQAEIKTREAELAKYQKDQIAKAKQAVKESMDRLNRLREEQKQLMDRLENITSPKDKKDVQARLNRDASKVNNLEELVQQLQDKFMSGKEKNAKKVGKTDTPESATSVEDLYPQAVEYALDSGIVSRSGLRRAFASYGISDKEVRALYNKLKSEGVLNEKGEVVKPEPTPVAKVEEAKPSPKPEKPKPTVKPKTEVKPKAELKADEEPKTVKVEAPAKPTSGKFASATDSKAYDVWKKDPVRFGTAASEGAKVFEDYRKAFRDKNPDLNKTEAMRYIKKYMEYADKQVGAGKPVDSLDQWYRDNV